MRIECLQLFPEVVPLRRVLQLQNLFALLLNDSESFPRSFLFLKHRPQSAPCQHSLSTAETMEAMSCRAIELFVVTNSQTVFLIGLGLKRNTLPAYILYLEVMKSLRPTRAELSGFNANKKLEAYPV